MNKNIIFIAGGCVASAVVGAGVSYYATVRRLGGEFDKRLEKELASAKKLYSIQLMEAREKPDTPEAALLELQQELQKEENKIETVIIPENVSEQITKYQGGPGKYAREANTTTNYSKVSTEKIKEKAAEEPAEDEDESDPAKRTRRNIWADEPKHESDVPRPRDSNGRFVPSKIADDPPYEITQEEFLQNHLDFEMINCVWYATNETLLDYAMNDIEIGLVGGREILDLLRSKTPDSSGDKIVCVRNDKMAQDYEIKLSQEDLADVMQLNED